MSRLTPPLLAALLLVAPAAWGDLRAAAPAGPNVPLLAVRVNLAAGVVVAGEQRVPIALDRALFPAEANVTAEALAIGAGRHLVHVRVPSRNDDGVAWEALLVGGQPQPLFAGVTGLSSGDPGERVGKAVHVLPSGDKNFVLVGDLREDLRICGQDETLLDPQAVYPGSLDLRPATVQQLDLASLENAQRIVAVDKGNAREVPLSKLLVARGSSVPGSRGVEVTDGDPETTWSEARPGAGQGEFVVMAAPRGVPIARVQIALSPKVPDKQGAAPKNFYLVTTAQTFQITIPGDAWLKPGQVYEVVFPKPIETSCVSLVLGDAYTRDLPHPQVTVAELTGYSEFDTPAASLDDVAKQLSGPRGAVAAQVLERAGSAALPAVERAYDAFDAQGRALAIDVAASHDPCEDSAPVLVRGLCEASGEAPRKAHEKLERCKGAANVLAARLRDDVASRACVAPALVTLAGSAALEPIADALNATAVSDAPTRSVLRSAFSQALHGAEPDRLAMLLGDSKRGVGARLELMRAAGPRIVEARNASDRALAEIFAGAPDMRQRFVALGPLGELARAGDASAVARVAEALTHDGDWPVRARAAEVSPGVVALGPALLAAARDAEPRVREAALAALAGSPDAAVLDVAGAALDTDHWSFVKVQALGILARSQPSGDVDKVIGSALKDASPRVRGAAVVALGRRRAAPLAKAVRERLDDPREDVEVRAASARVLGALCDSPSLASLTALARKLAAVGASEDEQQVALGALEALAAMQPPDLAERLAPLRSQAAVPSVRSAADRALRAHGACR